MFVVDASVSLAWCIASEATPYTESNLERLRATGATVPSLWSLEVANALLVAERRKRIDRFQTGQVLEIVAELPIVIEEAHVSRHWTHLPDLARSHALTAYDAA